MLDVYDLDANGTGPLITRQGHLIRKSGTIDLDLWSADWKIPAGHRIGVKVADANGDWWVHVPTKQTVTVAAARSRCRSSRRRATPHDPGRPGHAARRLPVGDRDRAAGDDR